MTMKSHYLSISNKAQVSERCSLIFLNLTFHIYFYVHIYTNRAPSSVFKVGDCQLGGGVGCHWPSCVREDRTWTGE